MTVGTQWKREFEVLKNYIVSDPEISIGIHEHVQLAGVEEQSSDETISATS